MTQFHDYLAEEVAVDYGDGIINRREALRRLGLLGVGAAVATTLLAACGRGGPRLLQRHRAALRRHGGSRRLCAAHHLVRSQPGLSRRAPEAR